MVWLLPVIIGAISAAAGIDQSIKNNKLAQDNLDLAEEQLELDREALLIDMESNLFGLKGDKTDLETQLSTTEIQITEYESKISDYETFLENFPEYAQYQKDVTIQEGKQQFGQLLENFNATNLMAAARGQSTAGTSAGAVVDRTGETLTAFAGDDYAFNLEGGGLFAQGYQQLVTDLNTKEQEAEDQLAIFEEGLEGLYGTKEGLEESIEEYDLQIEELEEEIELFEEGDYTEETEETDKNTDVIGPGQTDVNDDGLPDIDIYEEVLI